MNRPLFLTGLARGGTNLLARMLIAGGANQIAIHAFQPWFKSLRNAIVRNAGPDSAPTNFDAAAPFGDGYFNDRDLAVQALLHDASLDIPFRGAEWPTLLAQLQARASDEETSLVPALPGLEDAPTYRSMMDRIRDLIVRNDRSEAEFVGLIETWIIDLFPPLARAYPDAHFIVVIRDPRAIISSVLKFLDVEPSTVGHILSILRQWRKYVAVSYAFSQTPLFAGRFKLVRYEDEVLYPERFARDISSFLGVPYRARMLDFSHYHVDSNTKRPWGGNSAFTSELQQFDQEPVERWRRALDHRVLAVAEFCCGSDMQACGYPLYGATEPDAREVLNFLVADGQRDCAWRTDSGDAQAEHLFEILRRSLLAGHNQPDSRGIRRAFLYQCVFEVLRAKGRLATGLTS
jgi:hypothetical protein